MVFFLQEWSLLFLLVLWKSYNQILLAFKVKFPVDSQFLCQIPRLWRLMWGSEPFQQWENFFGIIVIQFVGHPPSRDLILLWLCAFYYLVASYLWTWVTFSGGSHPLMSTTSCDSGPLKGGGKWTSFYSEILNQKPTFFLISLFLEEPLTSYHIYAWHPWARSSSDSMVLTSSAHWNHSWRLLITF